jgi:lactate dehydrogenase-like 2-hydroxyacid dehydrogenase
LRLQSPGPRIVNIARERIIDEEALVEAMAAEKVLGVGLDVMEFELVVNPELRNNYLVMLLPHVGVCFKDELGRV